LSSSPVRVVGAIIVRNDLVFAARRNPERGAGGMWEFPGGKIEPGETPEQALRRELIEELSIDAAVGELASRHTTPVGSARVDLACYWAELASDPPVTSTDHDQFGWFTPEQLHQLGWSPADVPIVRDAFPVVAETDGRTHA
jgi:8-oxo-dGTP diphosphatase